MFDIVEGKAEKMPGFIGQDSVDSTHGWPCLQEMGIQWTVLTLVHDLLEHVNTKVYGGSQSAQDVHIKMWV